VDLYVIIRRNGWATPQDLEAAGARSSAEGDKDGSGVRWIRSYVLTCTCANILRKLDCPSRAAAATRAGDLGLLTDQAL
jgi:hypothetical protein